MSRSPVSTRIATIADLPVLLDLWRELRQVGGRAERAVNPVAVPDVADRLLEAMSREEIRVVIACVAGAPAGMAVMRAVHPDPLSASRVVQISHAIVDQRHRRRGIGHALVSAAADYADELGIEHVAAGIYPSLRDASRFYARLGFAPLVVERVAPVGVLRRRLGADGATRGIDDIVRRRTKLRRPVPVQRITVHPPAAERIDS